MVPHSTQFTVYFVPINPIVSAHEQMLGKTTAALTWLKFIMSSEEDRVI